MPCIGVSFISTPSGPIRALQSLNTCSLARSNVASSFTAHHQLLEGGGAVERLAQVGDAADVERVGRRAGGGRRGDLHRHTEGWVMVRVKD